MERNERLYFIKLPVEWFETPEIFYLEGLEYGLAYSLTYIKMLLLSVKTNGRLQVSDEIPFTAPLLAKKIGISVKIINQTITELENLKLLQKDSEGFMYLKRAVELTTSMTPDAIKKRKQRQNKENVGTISGQCP